MAKRTTLESIAAELTVPERVLLFCIASDTDWQAANITRTTAQGRAALTALLSMKG